MENIAPYVPRKTQEEMAQPHLPGDRHAALFRIAMPLLGNGMAPDAVFAQLRASFDAEKSDKEIRDVIAWCVEKGPSPSIPVNGQIPHNAPRPPFRGFASSKPAAPPATPAENAAAVLGGEEFGEDYWLKKSPVPIPPDFTEHAALLLGHLYGAKEGVNLLAKYTVSDKGKANPQGAGKTQERDSWLAWFAEKGAPYSDAGAWIRPNPCKPVGSGKDGAIKDSDITSCRFVMIESDTLSLETQFSLYAKLPLPVAAIILSGGDSAHAWLKMDCRNEEEYDALVAEFYSVADKLGFDRANKNPSRLSRLPGVPRKIGASGTGQQRLIYLNPNPAKYDFSKFKAHATPVIGLIRGDAMEARLRIYMAPRKPAFTMPYFAGKNADEGFYFREGEVTVWSGMASHGKSTMLSTIMLSLIAQVTPFFVCSLEYKPEKLCEMLAVIMCRRPISADEGVEFLQMAGRYFTIADVIGEITPENLISMMRAAHIRYGSRHFFIDSLMRVSGLEEDYPRQGQFVNELQAVAKETGGHIHLVAHPRKIDEAARTRKMDVKGSSLIVNNADNVVTMRRNTEKRDLMERDEMTPELDAAMHDAEFAVEKQRETGWEGVIKLRFNRSTKIFEAYQKPAVMPHHHDSPRRPHRKRYP